MQGDWIKLHRKLIENPIMQHDGMCRLWVYLLLKSQLEGRNMADSWNNKAGFRTAWIADRRPPDTSPGFVPKGQERRPSAVDCVAVAVVFVRSWLRHCPKHVQPLFACNYLQLFDLPTV